MMKLYWLSTVLVLIIWTLLLIAKADEEVNSNTIPQSNGSSTLQPPNNKTSKAFNRNLYFFNDSYILNKTAVYNAFIRLENTSLFLSNAIVIGSKMVAGGSGNYSVLIENSVFENSEIVIDSASNVTIINSHFKMEDIAREDEANHVVKVYNTSFFFMLNTHFGNQSIQDNQNDRRHSGIENSTNLGINLENVTTAELKGCTFAGIKAYRDFDGILSPLP